MLEESVINLCEIGIQIVIDFKKEEPSKAAKKSRSGDRVQERLLELCLYDPMRIWEDIHSSRRVTPKHKVRFNMIDAKSRCHVIIKFKFIMKNTESSDIILGQPPTREY